MSTGKSGAISKPKSRSGRLVIQGFIGLAVVVIVYVVANRSPGTLPTPDITSTGTSAGEENFAVFRDVSADPTVRMVLVNHHLLASHLIAGALARVATPESVTVVIIAPDHFGGGPTWTTTGAARWQTPFGIMETDRALVDALVRAGAAPRSAAMEREHGITNLTPYIHRALPNARLVPLLVKSGAPDDIISRLADALASRSDGLLVVGSFDFTHESTAAEALANDAESIRILEAGDASRAFGIVTDSVSGVRLLMEYASRVGLRFSLLERSDASLLLSRPEMTDVTSYITGVWRP